MDGINLARKIVSEVDKNVKRVYWTNEELDKFFGKRSAKEILQNGTTCFMNACLDLTLASAYYLSSDNIPYEVVIEEYPPTPEFNFNRVHFYIIFQNSNEDCVINYKRENEVYVFEGKYNGIDNSSKDMIFKIPGNIINPYRNLSKNIEYANLKELIKDKFANYSLEKNLNKLKQDNSKENYESYKKRCGEEFSIITNSL